MGVGRGASTVVDTDQSLVNPSSRPYHPLETAVLYLAAVVGPITTRRSYVCPISQATTCPDLWTGCTRSPKDDEHRCDR